MLESHFEGLQMLAKYTNDTKRHKGGFGFNRGNISIEDIWKVNRAGEVRSFEKD